MFLGRRHRGEHLRTLRRCWRWVALAYVVIATCGAWILSSLDEAWWPWGVGALVTAAYQSMRVWQLLPLNHPPETTQHFATFGAANLLTLARGVPQLLLGGFLVTPTPSGWLRWMPSLLYGLTIVGDYFDGYLARTRGRVTVMGARLDMAYDALSIVLIGVLGVRYGVLPWWYLAVPLARPLFVFGIWLRRRLNRPVAPFAYTATSRMVAGLQMGFLAGAMTPISNPSVTRWLATFFMAPLIAGFLRDWGLVSGRLDPASDEYRRYLQALRIGLTQQLPLALRALSAPLALLSWRFRAGGVLWGGLLASALIALGVAGRTAAVVLLILAAWTGPESGFDLIARVQLALGATVLFVGTGPYAFWAPERRLLLKRAGG